MAFISATETAQIFCVNYCTSALLFVSGLVGHRILLDKTESWEVKRGARGDWGLDHLEENRDAAKSLRSGTRGVRGPKSPLRRRAVPAAAGREEPELRNTRCLLCSCCGFP